MPQKYLCATDILTPTDHNILESIHNKDEPGWVDGGNVARSEPSVLSQDLLCLFGLVVVVKHHERASEKQFASRVRAQVCPSIQVNHLGLDIWERLAATMYMRRDDGASTWHQSGSGSI